MRANISLHHHQQQRSLSAPAARQQQRRQRQPLAVQALHKEYAAGGAKAADAGAAGARAAPAPILEPDAATIEMLTVLRDPRSIEQLAPFLPEPADATRAAAPVIVAGVPVLEQGPLAGGTVLRCSGRWLPTHASLLCSSVELRLVAWPWHLLLARHWRQCAL